ncbi:hypothetical protein SKAU_G00177680 [Synaphobranchus kaupii]|uniref:Uncharacterized protein n=1 Tax=Synaphobranchus kaupii TaxID=118154 RepID=A0A9Q1FM03_SYNKA|nr:hypothetical protein SKAU_G00177680 [Synaphobranchus kaupii]
MNGHFSSVSQSWKQWVREQLLVPNGGRARIATDEGSEGVTPPAVRVFASALRSVGERQVLPGLEWAGRLQWSLPVEQGIKVVSTTAMKLTRKED